MIRPISPKTKNFKNSCVYADIKNPLKKYFESCRVQCFFCGDMLIPSVVEPDPLVFLLKIFFFKYLQYNIYLFFFK